MVRQQMDTNCPFWMLNSILTKLPRYPSAINAANYWLLLICALALQPPFPISMANVSSGWYTPVLTSAEKDQRFPIRIRSMEGFNIQMMTKCNSVCLLILTNSYTCVTQATMISSIDGMSDDLPQLPSNAALHNHNSTRLRTMEESTSILAAPFHRHKVFSA